MHFIKRALASPGSGRCADIIIKIFKPLDELIESPRLNLVERKLVTLAQAGRMSFVPNDNFCLLSGVTLKAFLGTPKQLIPGAERWRQGVFNMKWFAYGHNFIIRYMRAQNARAKQARPRTASAGFLIGIYV